MDAAPAPDFQVSQSADDPLLMRLYLATLSVALLPGKLISRVFEWHEKHWWMSMLLLVLMLIGWGLEKTTGVPATMGWALSNFSIYALKLTVLLPIMMGVVWTPVILLVALPGYPIMYYFKNHYRGLPDVPDLQIWLTPMAVTVEGLASIGKRSQGRVRQRFSLLTANLQDAIQRSDSKELPYCTLSLTDAEGRVWSFPRLVLSDSQEQMLRDALSQAQDAADDRQGAGRKEIPAALTGLQEV